MEKKNETRIHDKEMLWHELEQYEKQGCRIYLNGRPSGPEQVISECLRENGCYMRDFVSDDEKYIRKIDFIKVAENS